GCPAVEIGPQFIIFPIVMHNGSRCEYDKTLTKFSLTPEIKVEKYRKHPVEKRRKLTLESVHFSITVIAIIRLRTILAPISLMRNKGGIAHSPVVTWLPDYSFGTQRSSLVEHVFGTRSLPLREAVESIPRHSASFRSDHRLPLRDAVEKRPYPDLGINPFDIGSTTAVKSMEPMSKAAHYYGNKVTGMQPYNVICYVEGWAVYRKDPMRFSSLKLDPFACTHLDEEYDIVKGGYRAMVGLKRINPQLKILISVGGWVEGSHKFSQMASSALIRREFIRSVIHFLDAHGFDGLDLDWEYPGATDLGGKQSDKEHFSLLIEELSEVFAPRGWLLSAAVSPSRFRLEDAYDVYRLARYLDFVNLMSFDLHAERDRSADHHAPLFQRKHDTGLNVFYNVDYAVRYWLKKGMPRDKLIVGIPFYGRSFTLSNINLTLPSSPIRGFGKEGYYTQERGFLAYFEICDLLEDKSWRRETDDVGSPYIVKGDQWIGYDDKESISTKMSYIRKNRLGGAMVWAVDLDDFEGHYGEKWPLLSTVKHSLLGKAHNLLLNSSSLSCTPSPKTDKLPISQFPVFNPPPIPGSPVSVEPDQVNCTGQGYVRDPNNCAIYYLCEWGMKHTYVCPEGLHYDSSLNLCNWPHLAGCELQVSPAVESNPQNEQEEDYKIVCYFTSWAFYRKGDAKFVPEHVDTRLCTHIIYAYASLDPEDLVIKPFDNWADMENNFYQRLTSLQRPRLHGDVKVLLALGGWTDSTGDKYSRLVSDGSSRRKFVGSVLVQELSKEFRRHQPPLELAVALSGYKEVIYEAYDLQTISHHVDFMSVMTYDYHGAWEQRLGHVSPLYYRAGDEYPQYNV
ncbi:hypothetical protein L9F63_022158, partial [Diploptera punctata]